MSKFTGSQKELSSKLIELNLIHPESEYISLLDRTTWSNEGLVINFWPKTGTVEFQGLTAKAHAAKERFDKSFCQYDTDFGGNCPFHPNGCPPNSWLFDSVEDAMSAKDRHLNSLKEQRRLAATVSENRVKKNHEHFNKNIDAFKAAYDALCLKYNLEHCIMCDDLEIWIKDENLVNHD